MASVFQWMFNANYSRRGFHLLSEMEKVPPHTAVISGVHRFSGPALFRTLS